jgi:hypothetical protein
MHENWRADYKGFGIVPGASWSTGAPYTANFSITWHRRDGEVVVIYAGQCGGVYESDADAWAAARAAAQEVIDTFPTGGVGAFPTTVKTPDGDGTLICHAMPTADDRFRGHVTFACVAQLPQGHLCDAIDTTREEALRRAVDLANKLYPTR